MKNPPCKDCKDRHRACHDSCEKFNEWKSYNSALKLHIQETTRPQEVDIVRSQHIARVTRKRNDR